MKNKKFLIGLSIFLVFFSLIILFNSKNNSSNEVTNKNTIEKKEEISTEPKNNNSKNSKIEFLKSVKGVNAKNIELTENPVGLKGEFLVPKESILNGVNYFLKNNKNEKIDNVNIELGQGYVDFKANYKLNESIKTPVMIRIYPDIDNMNNLVLNIDEVRFLDLKLLDWIVDIGVKNIVKDLFSSNKLSVEFKEGLVVIYKENFEEIILNKLDINTNDIIIDMFIDLEKII